jgi:D-glycero-D-manno-heptose 1,7-bisphosphate phosphatase
MKPGSTNAKRRAVFFDKDGTLVDDVPYNVDPSRITMARGARACLQLLRAADFSLFVISNQPGVAMGLFEEGAIGPVRRKMERLANVYFDGFYICPHHRKSPRRRCVCRKPQPGMIVRAADEHRLDLSESWLVGDILDDVEAGRRAGVRTILLDVGNETEWVDGEMRRPDFTAKSLVESAATILKNSDLKTEEALVDVRG